LHFFILLDKIEIRNILNGGLK
jgi:hypothetical protein